MKNYFLHINVKNKLYYKLKPILLITPSGTITLLRLIPTNGSDGRYVHEQEQNSKRVSNTKLQLNPIFKKYKQLLS